MAGLRISNRAARHLWLASQGLAETPTGPVDTGQIIRDLGMVQLDTIRVIARAHDHILWSRNQNYREHMLHKVLARDRQVFEHFTHDASVIPIGFHALWHRQFDRMRDRADRSGHFRSAAGQAECRAIRERIRREGPLSTHDFDSKHTGKREMWSRPPHKRALDFMWYAGELATSHREGFTKFYDLSERVIPDAHRQAACAPDQQLSRLCHAAIDRMSFGTPGEIQRFWEVASAQEVRAWCDSAGEDLIEVEVQTSAGDYQPALAHADIETRLNTLNPPTSRLRILNPFDPVIRERGRLLRLFGFAYRVEMFVPAAKRQWGYYVFPLLEGDRFVGRLEAKADRKTGVLNVNRLWAEPGVRWTSGRAAKLDAELGRMARFVGLDRVVWNCTAHPSDPP